MADETPPTSPAPTPVPDPAPRAPGQRLTRREEGVMGLLKLAPLVVVGASLGMYFLRPASPTARVESELARARSAIESKHWLDATQILERIALDHSIPDAKIRDDAAGELAKLADRAVVEKLPLSDVSTILGAELEVLADSGALEPTNAPLSAAASQVLNTTVSHALDRVTAELNQDPKGAGELAVRLIPLLEGTELEPRARDARIQALDAAIARDPKDPEALAARAAIEFAEGKIDEARQRLEPVADKLGTGEGARVLGLARLRAGQIDESVAYLSSYFEANRPAFERATQGFSATLARAVERAELDPALLLLYRKAQTDEARKKIKDEFVGEQVRSDPRVKAARQGVLMVSPLLDVAIALSQVEIAKARGATAGERESRLDRASRELQAVKWLGVGNDNWWVWVARLKIAAGKTADLETVIDAYLDARSRSYSALFVASEVLAEGNDLELARARAEEAVAHAPTPTDKEHAAELRARIAETPQEQIHWLEQAGKRPQVTAMIAQANASLAVGEGRFDDAAAAFTEAQKFYESETGALKAPPIHVALLVLARSEATGKAADLDDAITRLEAQANTKDEAASPLALDALADALQARATVTVVGDRVRSELLRDRSLELVDFAAADETEAAALAQALAANPDFVRSRALRERCTVETPLRTRPYASLVSLAWKTRDLERLEALVTRIEKTALDRTEDSRQLAELWSGKHDEAQRRALVARRQRADAVIALARATGHAPTIACALGARSALEREASSLGADADHDVAIKLAEEAFTLAPRRSTRLELRNALLARVAVGLRASSQVIRGLVAEDGKIGDVAILTWAVRKDPDLVASLARNPDVQRALTLHAEAVATAAPQSNDARLFAIAGDPRAGDAAKKIAGSRLLLAGVRAHAGLVPDSPDVVNELINVLEACGDTAGRAQVLDEAKKANLRLPYDLLR